MKLSSYHIQKGDIVMLAQEEMDLKYQHDLMYVVREGMIGSIPPLINARDTRVKLIGKAFRFYDNYMPDIDEVQAACRPDYTLYPIKEENRLSKADMVQFYSNGKRLNKIQNFENAYRKSHYTYIIDADFWTKNIEDIRACVSLIQKSKNVAFKEPISLKNILERPEVKEIFFSLNYDKRAALPLVNDCSYERRWEVIEFLVEFKKRYPTTKIPVLQFPTTSGPHRDTKHAFEEFEECLKILDVTKEYQIHIQFIGPLREETTFWFYFEELETWTRYRETLSFIEHMATTSSWLHKLPVDSLLWEKSKWSTTQIEMLMDLIKLHPDTIAKYGFRKWGDSYYHHQNIESILRRYTKC
jgi:hypothetical protein